MPSNRSTSKWKKDLWRPLHERHKTSASLDGYFDRVKDHSQTCVLTSKSSKLLMVLNPLAACPQDWRLDERNHDSFRKGLSRNIPTTASYPRLVRCNQPLPHQNMCPILVRVRRIMLQIHCLRQCQSAHRSPQSSIAEVNTSTTLTKNTNFGVSEIFERVGKATITL